jgi:hypothetical protein
MVDLRDAAARGAWVLHGPTQLVGQLCRFLAPGEHVGDDGRSVDAQVVELAAGHRFLADEESFEELSEPEVALYCALERELGTVIAGAFVAAGERGGLEPERAGVAIALVRAALSAQLRELGRRPA